MSSSTEATNYILPLLPEMEILETGICWKVEGEAEVMTNVLIELQLEYREKSFKVELKVLFWYKLDYFQ